MSKNNKKRKWRTRRTTRRKSFWSRINPLWVLIPGSLLVLVLGVWLTTQGGPSAELAQAYSFPPFLAKAAANVQTAYAQVVNYQNEMEFMACYCGCGPGNGHRSLKDCYIAGTNPDGSIAYGQHALT
ncbi:MAG: hypothetical protein GTN71_17205 [Anaerolineae bacterium]|nr:hypothetical protein [Anaerolineae bacterium]